MERRCDMTYRDYVGDRLAKTSLDMSVDEWTRLQFKAAVPLSAALAMSAYFIWKSLAITAVALVLSFAAIFLGFILLLDYFAYAKGREVEDVLPEALELLSSNIRSGLPVKESIQMLMSEEFGQLGVEMSIATTEMSTGSSITDALRATRFRVSSQLYSKMIDTVARSIESGANLGTICSQLAKNINDMHNIRKEIRASTVTYTLFLSFAALIASPILFALSTFLVEASTQIFAVASAEGASGGGIPSSFLSFSTTLPPVGLLKNFFLVAIGITAIFTSLGVGIVREGSMRVGLRFMPVFLAIAFTVYFVAKSSITSLVGLSV